MESQGVAHIVFVRTQFFIPDAGSLKAKRSVLNRMRDRTLNEFNVSAAEIGYQDKWQRSEWGFCMVGSDKAYLDAAVQRLIVFLQSGRAANLADYEVEYL